MRLEKEMCEIYRPDLWGNIDWLEVKKARNNPYTFHHIKEVRNGGKLVVSNGAILTSSAHQWLNVIDNQDRELYRLLNHIFLELNRTKAPPTKEYYMLLRDVLAYYERSVDDYAKKRGHCYSKRGSKWGK